MVEQMRDDLSEATIACCKNVASVPSPVDVAVALRKVLVAALPISLAAFATWFLAKAPVSGETSVSSTRAEDVVSSAPVRVSELARFQRLAIPQLDAAYNFARFLSRDAEAAQDIVQDAFLRAYRGFDTYQGASVKAWLFAIVRNCHHDWQLERRRTTRIEIDAGQQTGGDDVGLDLDNVASEEDTPETTLIRKTEAHRVRRVLLRLNETSREMLVLRELEELSYREIAEVAGLPIGTVMSRLARARREFADEWSRDDLARGTAR